MFCSRIAIVLLDRFGWLDLRCNVQRNGTDRCMSHFFPGLLEQLFLTGAVAAIELIELLIRGGFQTEIIVPSSSVESN